MKKSSILLLQITLLISTKVVLAQTGCPNGCLKCIPNSTNCTKCDGSHWFNKKDLSCNSCQNCIKCNNGGCDTCKSGYDFSYNETLGTLECTEGGGGGSSVENYGPLFIILGIVAVIVIIVILCRACKKPSPRSLSDYSNISGNNGVNPPPFVQNNQGFQNKNQTPVYAQNQGQFNPQQQHPAGFGNGQPPAMRIPAQQGPIASYKPPGA